MPKPKKPQRKPKPAARGRAVTFDVPAQVKTTPQSGWVYKSAAPATPVASAAPRRGGGAEDLLISIFAVPLCMIFSLVPSWGRGTRTA